MKLWVLVVRIDSSDKMCVALLGARARMKKDEYGGRSCALNDKTA